MSGPTDAELPRVPTLPLRPVLEASDGGELLSDATAARLAARIESGEFKPGDRLPAERDLANEMGVSRIVVREAFSALQALGMVEAHVGRGRFVVGQSSDGRSSFFVQRWLQLHQSELEDLSVVRQVLETAAVRLVPKDQLPGVGETLRTQLNEARAAAAAGDAESVARLDALFHAATVEQSANRPLRNLATSIMEAVHPSAVAVMSIKDARDTSLDEHERIVRAFEDGDLELAAILIAHHQDSGQRRALLHAKGV